MLKAKDIMTTEVVSIRETTSIEELARLFVEKRVSSMPVLDEAGAVVGLVSESDLVEQNRPLHLPTVVSIFDWVLYLGGEKDFRDEVARITAQTVSEICRKPAVVCTSDATTAEIAELMAENKVHLVSVVDGGRLCGVVARLDLIRAMRS